MAKATEDFYLRYYVGHKGKFGHEFLEFEFRPDGKLRYANNSNYKNDTMIRKEAYVHHTVMEELKRIIVDSEIMQEDDSLWPPPDRVGRQVSSKPYHTNKTTTNPCLRLCFRLFVWVHFVEIQFNFIGLIAFLSFVVIVVGGVLCVQSLGAGNRDW